MSEIATRNCCICSGQLRRDEGLPGPYYHDACAVREIDRLKAENSKLAEEMSKIIRQAESATEYVLAQINQDLKAENERLRRALRAIVEFDEMPLEAKRPDVFQLRLNAARAALSQEPKGDQP